jgi:WD40-like Beta Propeller Repeat
MLMRKLFHPTKVIRCTALTIFLFLTAGCQAFPTQLPVQPVSTQTSESTTAALSPTSTPLQPDQPALSPLPIETTPVIIETATAAPPSESEPLPAPPTLPPSGGPQLAFLKDQDVWLLDQPTGQPYPLTVAGDILNYAWSPDGQRLVTYNGRSLCFFHSDGSVRTACLDLGLDANQAQIPRNVIWSPDQRWIVLWNSLNPWDEGAIGWLIVSLDTSNEMYRIQDPVDWGASLAPNNEAGGFTGQPVFLDDGKLVGTLTHRYLCSEGGCHYQLYEFNFETKSLVPYPNKPQEGWSEGLKLVLSDDGRSLTNFGVYFFGCDSYVTFADSFNLSSQDRVSYNLENQAMIDLALSPDAKTGVFARTAGCLNQDSVAWSQTCGLFPGFEVYTMQYWDLAGGKIRDLPTGINPDWSPDGQLIAFNSCLVINADGAWEPSANTPTSIYLLDLNDNLTSISTGSMPSWRPR